jgi:hypothetical protein
MHDELGEFVAGLCSRGRIHGCLLIGRHVTRAGAATEAAGAKQPNNGLSAKSLRSMLSWSKDRVPWNLNDCCRRFVPRRSSQVEPNSPLQ